MCRPLRNRSPAAGTGWLMNITALCALSQACEVSLTFSPPQPRHALELFVAASTLLECVLNHFGQRKRLVEYVVGEQPSIGDDLAAEGFELQSGSKKVPYSGQDRHQDNRRL